jgi:hypothetical protein
VWIATLFLLIWRLYDSSVHERCGGGMPTVRNNDAHCVSRPLQHSGALLRRIWFTVGFNLPSAFWLDHILPVATYRGLVLTGTIFFHYATVNQGPTVSTRATLSNTYL